MYTYVRVYVQGCRYTRTNCILIVLYVYIVVYICIYICNRIYLGLQTYQSELHSNSIHICIQQYIHIHMQQFIYIYICNSTYLGIYMLERGSFVSRTVYDSINMYIYIMMYIYICNSIYLGLPICQKVLRSRHASDTDEYTYSIYVFIHYASYIVADSV